MKVELVTTLDAALSHLPPVRLGRVATGDGAPVAYVAVERADGERLRLDVHADPGEELCVATEAVAWGRWVAVGFAGVVYLVDPGTRATRVIHLPMYFQRFVVGDGWLLAVSGAGLTRIGPGGGVVWENAHVAVDGVTIEDVRDGEIHGDAEMDPPGGWRPFRVDLATGRSLPVQPGPSSPSPAP